MKNVTKLVKKVITLAILFALPVLSFSQFNEEKCLYDFDETALIPTNPSGVYESKNGWFLPVHGTIRLLVVFAQIDYDTGTDPNPNNQDEWDVGKLPAWADNLFDANVPSGQAQGLVTRYFQEASFGSFNVLGDYLVKSPNNDEIFTVLYSEIQSQGYDNALINKINQVTNGNFYTGHGLNNVTYFDNWTVTSLGKEKITPTIDSPHKYDHVVFIWRNRTGYNGTGTSSPGTLNKLLLGYKADSYMNIGSNNKIPTSITRHEFSHQLFGGNNFHCAGGGWGPDNYWIPITGGWSALGLSVSSLLCWNAWDRQRLDWKPAGNTYEISARDQNNAVEVNGDLDATNPDDAGIYTLRDFITTGDAIRIKLPFIDPVNEFPEYIWLENHTGTQNNGSPFDRWHFQDSDCVDDFTPGLMAYLQIDKDTRSSDNYLEVFGGYADYLRPLTAEGFYERTYESNQVFNDCVQWGNTYAFSKGLQNPFTGGGDEEKYTVDVDGSGDITRDDIRDNFVELKNGDYYKNLFELGHNDHVFTLNGNNKIGITTNPSSASMMNMVSYENPKPGQKNLRRIYLNGISIEIIGIDANNNLQIRIRFDDVDIDRNVRWCADEIVLNPIITESGYSLNIKAGKTLTLDQSLTATRMDNPIVVNGENIFADPTTFIVKPDAKINLEPNAKIQLKDNSTMHLNTASHCIVGNNGNIEVKSGTTFYIDDCGILEIIGNGKLIVRSGATLCISPNAVLAFENGLQNLIMESGVTIPNGYVDPTILINNTLSNYTINTNTTWTSENYFVNGSLTIEPQSSLTIKTSTLNFVDKNSNIIVKPGAKLIIDGSTLTNACSEPWQGIQVWGDKSHSQNPDANGNYAQGYLELKNGAVIENAVCAVDLWKPDDWSSTGGIVYADNVTFRNNAKSVHALYYHNYNPNNPTEEWEYSSNFKNCTFEITADYPGTETFYKHVDLSHVNGIDFQHCDFSVADNVNGVSSYNIGIAGYDAQLKVTALCSSQVAPCPEEDLEKCTFTGFYRGVSAVNDGGSPVTFYVNNANFINNAYGVKTRSMDNATVLFSDFEIGQLYSCGAGINSDNVTGFAYEENNFSKYTGGPQANYFGIVIHDSKDVNEVYKNSFTGLSYANFADGINWLWNGNPDEDNRYKGLAYYCNQNSNNYADFYVSENRPSGIQAFQGGDNNPAGNTFTQNGATWHFYNGGEHLVQYFYNQNAPNEIPDPAKINDVALTPVNDENGCPSHYGNDIRVVLTAAQKTDAEQTYYDNLSDYNNTKTLYDSYKDGGSTSDEELDIETAQPDDMWALRSQLLGDSPHLSFDVLKKAADKTDVFTESALFDILAANPDELRKDTLISYLENKEQPLPDYMIDLLKQLAEGTTYKTALQEQMAGYKHNYTRAALDIVRSILNDTVMNDTLLRNWLDNIGGITSDRQIISSYISEGDFTDAYTLANMLPNLYGLHGADSIEHLYYMDLLHLQDTLYQQGRNTYQLDSAEKTLVENIAASSNDVAGSYAKSILEAVYDDYYPDCPEVNNTAGYKHGNVINSETLGKVYGLDITVKPNPAGQWAAFDYTLPKDETNATITITNAIGSIVKVLNVTGNQGQKLFDTRSLSAGIYLYTLKSGSYSKSGKLIIRK